MSKGTEKAGFRPTILDWKQSGVGKGAAVQKALMSNAALQRRRNKKKK